MPLAAFYDDLPTCEFDDYCADALQYAVTTLWPRVASNGSSEIRDRIKLN